MLKDENYYKALFTHINKMGMPYVEQVIKNNNSEGRPINDTYFDRESLAQIVDEVSQRAKANKQLAEFINDVDPKVRQLIKNIAQALVLGELFVVHRPNTKLNEGNMINMDQKPYYMQQTPAEKVVKTKQFDNYAGETQRF